MLGGERAELGKSGLGRDGGASLCQNLSPGMAQSIGKNESAQVTGILILLAIRPQSRKVQSGWLLGERRDQDGISMNHTRKVDNRLWESKRQDVGRMHQRWEGLRGDRRGMHQTSGGNDYHSGGNLAATAVAAI